MTTFEQNKDLIKDNLRDYMLSSRGIELRHGKCFTCVNPAHNDKHPSMGYDEERNRVKCFSCGASYDTFDLIGIDYNLPGFMSQYKKACELYGLDGNVIAP